MKQNVGLVTLNRPKVLNALCDGLISELGNAVNNLEKDDSVGAIVITGNEKAFAAGMLPIIGVKFFIYVIVSRLVIIFLCFLGADIKEMLNQTYSANIKKGLLAEWNRVAECKKPLIAAVNGYAVI